MINSYDDLKAQRAQAHNDLQIAKSNLTADTRSWQEDVKPFRILTSVASNMFTNKLGGKGKKGLVGKGVQMGLNAVLARTAFKSLPLPLNMIVPHVLENVAINYTQKNGRDWLIKGLRWVKKITEEEPEPKSGVLLLKENTTSPAENQEQVAVVQPPVLPQPQ